MIVEVSAATDHRVVDDRRGRSNQWNLRWLGVGGRRRAPGRRAGDGLCCYLDFHSPIVFMLALGTFVLSMADAHFTLELLRRGATEVNLFMAALMERGVETFIWTKLVLTGVSVVFLVAHERLRLLNRVRVANLLVGAFGIYALLVCYELFLLSLG